MRTTIVSVRTRRRHPVLTGLAGVTLLGLAACGGSGAQSAAGADPAAKAPGTPAATASAGGASKPSSAGARSSVATPSVTELNRRIVSAIKVKGTARLAMTPGSTGRPSTGVMRFKTSGLDFAMSIGLPGGKTMKMVVVDGTAYMNVGEKYQGKNWIRFAPGGSDPLSKVLGPMLAQLGTGLNLDTQLADGKGAKIITATRTTLAGTPVTKYTLVSSARALLAQLDKFVTDPEMRATLRAQFKGAHSESVMWISDENLPLRVDSRVVGTTVPGTTTTVTYSDWGRPVSVSAPSRSDTVNLAG